MIRYMYWRLYDAFWFQPFTVSLKQSFERLVSVRRSD